MTGASGFIGKALCSKLSARGDAVRGAVRDDSSSHGLPQGTTAVPVGDIGPDTAWNSALDEIDAVVHLASRAHVMEETLADPLAEYRRVNSAGTEGLARAAAAKGIKRLIYMSSVKVNGEETAEPYREDDPPAPADPYAISKFEAEQALAVVSRETGLEFAVLRPPLVYGPGVKANFLRLLRTIDRGVPLPLASVRNDRSLIYVGNLVDAVVKCLSHPRAAKGTFLVDDGSSVSTPALIRAIAGALDRPARLLPCPVALIRVAGTVTGKSASTARLLGSLSVDSRKIQSELNWTPPFSMAEGLEDTANWYRETCRMGRAP